MWKKVRIRFTTGRNSIRNNACYDAVDDDGQGRSQGRTTVAHQNEKDATNAETEATQAESRRATNWNGATQSIEQNSEDGENDKGRRGGHYGDVPNFASSRCNNNLDNVVTAVIDASRAQTVSATDGIENATNNNIATFTNITITKHDSKKERRQKYNQWFLRNQCTMKVSQGDIIVDHGGMTDIHNDDDDADTDNNDSDDDYQLPGCRRLVISARVGMAAASPSWPITTASSSVIMTTIMKSQSSTPNHLPSTLSSSARALMMILEQQQDEEETERDDDDDDDDAVDSEDKNSAEENDDGQKGSGGNDSSNTNKATSESTAILFNPNQRQSIEDERQNLLAKKSSSCQPHEHIPSPQQSTSTQSHHHQHRTSHERSSLSVPNRCLICLESYHVGDAVVWSSNEECDHVFHRHCLIKYFDKLQRKRGETPCPCCRQVYCPTLQIEVRGKKNNRRRLRRTGSSLSSFQQFLLNTLSFSDNNRSNDDHDDDDSCDNNNNHRNRSGYNPNHVNADQHVSTRSRSSLSPHIAISSSLRGFPLMRMRGPVWRRSSREV